MSKNTCPICKSKSVGSRTVKAPKLKEITTLYCCVACDTDLIKTNKGCEVKR